MNEGKQFETDWKQSIPKDVYYLRIKDSPNSFNPAEEVRENGFSLRFTPKQPFDALMYIFPNLFLMELKSTKGTSFSFKGTTPMIKQHQIDELTKAAPFEGIVPGFIFNMRKYNKTYFLHITDFNKFLVGTEKNSINQKDIIEYGAIDVVGEIKKVHYRYLIGEFVKKMKYEIV